LTIVNDRKLLVARKRVGIVWGTIRFEKSDDRNAESGVAVGTEA
jgi:hypothetical protein